MMPDEEVLLAECNECGWKGYNHELITGESDDDLDTCPDCGSDDIYLSRQEE